MKKRTAFTLAEVLITLAIIGVVAALTIPTVVRNYTEKQTVTQVKKVYSQLNSAYQMAQVDYGSPESWEWQTDTTNQIVKKYFAPYLKITKNCLDGATGCFPNTTIYNLGKTKSWSNLSGNTSSLKLTDGVSVRFYHPPSWYPCRGDRYCMEITVDVNGDKGPSAFGRDIFNFLVTSKGIYPWGWFKNLSSGAAAYYCNKSSSVKESGHSCAAWVLQHGNTDYLRKNVVCTPKEPSGYDCHLE